MYGQPVWLASVSRRAPLMGNRTISTTLWSDKTRAEMTELLRRVVGPAGNVERERIFRMNITLCIHRALTTAEVDSLPPYFHSDEPTDLAGGPVEVLWENEEGALSTKPCAHPHRQYIDPRDPLLWIPLDCGVCDTCTARLDYLGERGLVDANR